MGEETNAYDPAGSQFDDDVTAERPTDRAAQSGQKAQATARAAEPVKPLISMSDLPDLRNTFNPNAPLDDSNDLSRDEFTTVYDIIDSIEEELDEAKPILFAPSSCAWTANRSPVSSTNSRRCCQCSWNAPPR